MSTAGSKTDDVWTIQPARFSRWSARGYRFAALRPRAHRWLPKTDDHAAATATGIAA